jgi:Zn-dependent peptidase ImmA (M78 family)/DNA-binding XRE family transcriptional regulator
VGSFNYSRVDLARRRRGITKAALADEVGISTRSLRKYERDEAEPSALTINQIAKVLNFPVEFFYGDTLDEPTVEGASFRSLTRLSASQRHQALASGALALAFSDWIAQRFDLPAATLPDYGGSDPETAAEAVREEWGIGEKPVGKLVPLLEAHGIRVFSLVEECKEVDAFSFWRGSLPYVFLNTMKTVERSRADAAHELGHLILHAHGGPRGREVEAEAHAFAAAFLMPRNSVIARLPFNASLAQIIKAKSYWRVSAVNLARRAFHLDLMTQWQYRNICIALSKRGWENEPRAIRKPESSQVIAKVLRALREEQVSPTAISKELSIPVDELSKSAFGHMFRPVAGTGQGSDPASAQDVEARRSAMHVVSGGG